MAQCGWIAPGEAHQQHRIIYVRIDDGEPAGREGHRLRESFRFGNENVAARNEICHSGTALREEGEIDRRISVAKLVPGELEAGAVAVADNTDPRHSAGPNASRSCSSQTTSP